METLAAEIAALAERVRPCVVAVRSRAGGGSGVIWRPDGLIVTNAHVMQRRHASVTLWNGSELKAKLCAQDSARDLAALRVDAAELHANGSDMPAARIGDDRTLRVGQMVFALGNPHGADPALSTGVVHAIGPVFGRATKPWVQAALRLHPGNSGGPLFDTNGAVVGINSMIAYGVALAVPARAVEDFITPAQAAPTIGIECEPVQLTASGYAELGLVSAEGLLIVSVATGSPAERAGLLIGDVICSVASDGEETRPADHLRGVLEHASLASVLSLGIVRGGKREVRAVVLAPRSSERTVAA